MGGREGTMRKERDYSQLTSVMELRWNFGHLCRYHSFRSDLGMLGGHIFMDECHRTKLNPSKTKLLVIPGDSSPGQDLRITHRNSVFSPSATACNLGVTMDNQLSFSSHVANVAHCCRFLLCNISRNRLLRCLSVSCYFDTGQLQLSAGRSKTLIQNAAA